MRTALVAAALAALAVPAHSQDDDAVVVTASRTEQRVRDSIPHTTVITRKEIRDSGAVDLPTLLRREAGFEFSQNGGIGTTSSTFLRGTATNQVLVLIDGVRVSSLTTGATALDQLMLDQIERVEIVRGGVSSLYGSGAIGGVIQVFTQRGRSERGGSIEIGAGEEGTRRLRAAYSGAVGAAGDTRFSINFSHYSTDGFSAQNPLNSPTTNPDRDGYRNSSLSGNLAHRFHADHEAGVRFFSSVGRVEFDNAFAASVNDKHTADAEVGALSLYMNNRLGSRWFSKLGYSLGRDRFDGYLNGNVTSRTTSRNTQISWQNDFVLAADQTASAGLERLEQEVSSTTAYVRPGRDVNAVFGGYQGRFGRHAVQLNVRSENYSDFGRARTHFGGYGFDLSDTVRLTASSAKSFRAPTFNELFFPGFGNPALRPERSRHFEAGVQYAAGPHLLRVVAFHARIDDLINPFPVVNINRAVIDGIETSYRGTLAGVDIRASLTIQDPIQHTASSHVQLVRRAKVFGGLSVGKSFGALRLGAELTASRQRFDNTIVTFTRVELAPYEVVNLTARYALDKQTSVSARLDNAFDKRYELAQGFNTQGRKLTAFLRHEF
ncbi:MAG: TonB-dependent receptor [Betaproteobacteria bacterium]|nr:TonB-dependent receptor [Betaproteobacteria bacterium]